MGLHGQRYTGNVGKMLVCTVELLHQSLVSGMMSFHYCTGQILHDECVL